MWRCLPAIGLASCISPPVERPPPRPATFNERVLALAAGYPDGGFGGYAWPAPAGRAGTTRDLVLGDHVIARGGEGNHCVGITLEVLWRALEACPGGPAAAFDAAQARAFRQVWYVPAHGGAGAAEALPAFGVGEAVALDAAQPGDFMQAWSRGGTGHAAIFLGWDRDDAGAITGVRYWSSQPWTGGIGRSDMAVTEAPEGFDPAQIYVARARCP